MVTGFPLTTGTQENTVIHPHATEGSTRRMVREFSERTLNPN